MAKELTANGILKRKEPMSEAERQLHGAVLQSPESQAKRKVAQEKPEYKAQLAERARQLTADGTFRRKSPISQEERDAQSERMKANNPVNSPEVREKIRQTLLAKRAMLSERAKTMHAAGQFGEHKPMGPEARAKISQLMTDNNPMKRPEVAAKVAMWHRWKNFANPKAMAETWIRAGVAPNKAEQKLAQVLAPLGFRFVGDGSFWIGPCQSGMCRNPDYIYKSGRRKIGVLLNGAYWHQLPNRNDQQEMQDYQAYGWKMLVIMESELSNTTTVLAKVKDWLAGLKSQD